MKKLKYLFLIIIASIFICFSFNASVCATNTGISTSELSDKDRATFEKNVNICFLKKDVCVEATGVVCFDVNFERMLAIGCNIGEISYICIHDKDCNFLYSYSFETSGSFAFEWNDNNIVIYFIRSGVAVSVDNMGGIIKIRKIEDTVENSIYMNASVNAFEKEVDGVTYIMRNNMLILPSFSQIVAVDEFGTETVLFDKTSDNAIVFVLCAAGVVLFISAVVFLLVFSTKKKTGDGSLS